jgi:rubredoxin
MSIQEAIIRYNPEAAEVEGPDTVECPECGSFVYEGTEECESCGYWFEEEAAHEAYLIAEYEARRDAIADRY